MPASLLYDIVVPSATGTNNAILESANLNNATVGTVGNIAANDDVFSNSTEQNNGETLLRTGFEDPSTESVTFARLNPSGIQTFRAGVRRSANSGGNNPEVALTLFVGGNEVTGVTNSLLLGTTGTTEQVVTLEWNTSNLSAFPTEIGNNIECRLEQLNGAGGRASNRAWVDVDYIQWEVSYFGPTVYNPYTQVING